MVLIYKISNLINNKLYVGKTSRTLDKRLEAHFLKAKRKINTRLYDSMNHHGYNNFKIEKIEECIKEQENERERHWIKLYKSNNPEFGYNMTEGGDGGDTTSNHPNNIKIREKRSKSMIGKNVGKIPWLKGKHGVYSAETIEKIKLNHWSRKSNAEETRAKIIEKLRKIRKIGNKIGKNNSMYGKHHSEESKAKIRETLTKRKAELGYISSSAYST